MFFEEQSHMMTTFTLNTGTFVKKQIVSLAYEEYGVSTDFNY